MRSRVYQEFVVQQPLLVLKTIVPTAVPDKLVPATYPTTSDRAERTEKPVQVLGGRLGAR